MLQSGTFVTISQGFLPLSNGITEKHNNIISKMIDKITVELVGSIDVAQRIPGRIFMGTL